jgi:hypothetical protein
LPSSPRHPYHHILPPGRRHRFPASQVCAAML